MLETPTEQRFWINAVSLDHVQTAAEGGFTQADHGARTRLGRLRPGDEMIFYSPRTSLQNGKQVRQFTALATITDAAHWGLPFRRGLFTIPREDFSTISASMSD